MMDDHKCIEWGGIKCIEWGGIEYYIPKATPLIKNFLKMCGGKFNFKYLYIK